MKVYFSSLSATDVSAAKFLRQHNHHIVNDSGDKAEIDVAVIDVNTVVDINFLSQFPQLKFLLTKSVGVDHIDLELCKKKNVQILTAAGVNAEAVAEHAMMLMLMLLRRVMPQMNRMRQGRWRSSALIGEQLQHKTVGIVGCGAIGLKVAERLQALQVAHLLGYDPFISALQMEKLGIKKTSLYKLLHAADIVTLHVPLTVQTQHLIAASEFRQMKPSAYLINTSRGKIVDEQALISAVQTQQIAGAALDVFEQEPNINPVLLELPNVITTPHIAAFTFEAQQAMSVEPMVKLIKQTLSHPVFH